MASTMVVLTAPSASANLVHAGKENAPASRKKPAASAAAVASSSTSAAPLASKHGKPLSVLRGANNAVPVRRRPLAPKDSPPPSAAKTEAKAQVKAQAKEEPRETIALAPPRPATSEAPAAAVKHDKHENVLRYTREELLALSRVWLPPKQLGEIPEAIRPRRVIILQHRAVEEQQRAEAEAAAAEVVDAHKQQQRQKQLDYGKNTPGFANYTKFVTDLHVPVHPYLDPIAPCVIQHCSKRSWDGQVRKWRRRLHFFDNVTCAGQVTLARQAILASEASQKTVVRVVA